MLAVPVVEAAAVAREVWEGKGRASKLGPLRLLLLWVAILIFVTSFMIEPITIDLL